MIQQEALLSQRGRAMLLYVSSQLQQYSTSSAVFYYYLLRLQIYHCVQLNCALCSSAYSSMLVVINKIHWCVAVCTINGRPRKLHHSRPPKLLIALHQSTIRKPDVGRESRFLPKPPAFDAPVRGPRKKISITFGMQKAEWCCYPMVRKG